MKKNALLLFLMLFCIHSSDGGIKVYGLDNYLIPPEQKGVYITDIIPYPNNLKILKDTSNKFCISPDKKGIALKKGHYLKKSQNNFRYSITIEADGNILDFKLLRDDFSKNCIIAHRGAWKSGNCLQNSVRSFFNAVDLGCKGSEFDVWMTADKKIILSHDSVIYGMNIENTLYKDIFMKSTRIKEPVPSLKKMLLFAKEQNTTHPIIEIKDSAYGWKRTQEVTDSVVSLVKRMKMQGYVWYSSFNTRVIERIRDLDPTSRIFFTSTYRKKLHKRLLSKISGIGYPYFLFRSRSAALQKKAHDHGLVTNAWVINNLNDMITGYQLGIDCITTDNPELLLKIIHFYE